MTLKAPIRTFLFATALGLVFFLSTGRALAECPEEIRSSERHPIHMLVLGDSILWGQGLKPQEKAWWRVKCWLQEKTGRRVKARVLAHSGAIVAASSTHQPRFKSNDGEVNLPFPSVNEQLDEALRVYGPDRSRVNLILVNGCINDVGVSNLLNAGVSVEWLRPRVEDRCGTGMRDLLRRVAEGFPQAYILVPGYYRTISSETEDNVFLRLLVKHLVRELSEREERESPALRMSDQERRQQLIAISEMWYRQSTASLAEAVSTVNSELAAKTLPPRISFVEIQFSPEHAFAARQTLLWNFVFATTNLSGVRKIIIAVSFGTAAYKTNDNTREYRSQRCNEIFKKPKGVKETKAEKHYREQSNLVCRYASLGHPNHMGALVYTEAIKGRLQGILNQAGWTRDSTLASTAK